MNLSRGTWAEQAGMQTPPSPTTHANPAESNRGPMYSRWSAFTDTNSNSNNADWREEASEEYVVSCETAAGNKRHRQSGAMTNNQRKQKEEEEEEEQRWNDDGEPVFKKSRPGPRPVTMPERRLSSMQPRAPVTVRHPPLPTATIPKASTNRWAAYETQERYGDEDDDAPFFEFSASTGHRDDVNEDEVKNGGGGEKEGEEDSALCVCVNPEEFEKAWAEQQQQRRRARTQF